MNRKLLSIFFVLIFGTLSAQENTKSEKAPIESSIVNIPLSIKISDIEKAINQEVKGLIYEDNSFEGDDLKIKAWKKSNIKVNLEGKTLKYYVPLKLQITMRYGAFGLYDTKTVEGAIALNFETLYDIKENWELETKTTVKSYKWLETPVLDLGITKVSIKFVADKLLNANKEMLSTEIDKEIKNSLDIKAYAKDAWRMMQDPILLDETYKIWLKLTPESIIMSPLTAKKGIIKSTIGIKALSEIAMGNKPTAITNYKLPPFKEQKNIPNNFSITLHTDIPYAAAEDALKTELVDETFGEGKRSVTIKDLDIFSEEDKMKVGVEMDGKFKGKIYLSGIPVHNTDSGTIEMTEFDYDVKTKNILHKSATWILKSPIMKRIEPYLVFPVDENIVEMRTMVEESLKNYEVSKGIFINGNLDKMEIKDVQLTPNGLRIILFANGNLDMKVDGLSF